MTHCIAYKDGYKYQLKQTYSVRIAVIPAAPIRTEYITLELTGDLTLKEGYAWDGPSGPTIDTKSFMRGSLVHDALYQLMREKQLDHKTYREPADRTLQAICKEDGMTALRAWSVYHGVRLFGDPSADPALDHPMSHAPKNCAA